MDEAREPEDRIEHIVREAEQGANFEFNPAAWSAMEQKLDQVQPVPFSLWKVLFPLAGVAMVLALLLWPVSAQDRARLATESPRAQVAQSVAETSKTETQAEPITGDAEVEEAAGATTENTQSQAEDQIPDISESNTNSNIRSVSTTDPASADAPEARQATPTNTPKAGANARSSVPVRRATLAAIPATGGSEPEDRQMGVDMLSVYWNPAPLAFPVPDLVFEVDSSNFREGEPAPDYFERSKWAFSAMVSLDMSATGFDGFTDPGTMFGVGVEYYIAKSWSIQSGAAIAVKKYSALGSEYENEWPAAQNDAFIEALANCLVIDIPLNIRKYFYTKKGKTFYASSGVSTYLMLREDYNYEYTENRPNWPTFWRFENQNNHFLGILNLSVGYETPIGKNLGLGIEPFMKLPLTGIGQGRVRFLSFGTNVAIKLRK